MMWLSSGCIHFIENSSIPSSQVDASLVPDNIPKTIHETLLHKS